MIWKRNNSRVVSPASTAVSPDNTVIPLDKVAKTANRARADSQVDSPDSREKGRTIRTNKTTKT